MHLWNLLASHNNAMHLVSWEHISPWPLPYRSFKRTVRQTTWRYTKRKAKASLSSPHNGKKTLNNLRRVKPFEKRTSLTLTVYDEAILWMDRMDFG